MHFAAFARRLLSRFCFHTLLLSVSIRTMQHLEKPPHVREQHSGHVDALPAGGAGPVLRPQGCVDAAVQEEEERLRKYR